MKLNNNGWGYRTFIMCVCMIMTFILIANYYIVTLQHVLIK